jgi:hypothetical protein
MDTGLVGAWKLVTWRRHPGDGSVVYPLGRSPHGLLIYSADGAMSVHMLVADRPALATDDPVGGSVEERASAYSTCLTYFGSWEARGNEVVHHVDAALFPNWSRTTQSRPFVFVNDQLILQVKDGHGNVTNEMVWVRPTPASTPSAKGESQ